MNFYVVRWYDPFIMIWRDFWEWVATKRKVKKTNGGTKTDA